MASFWGSHKIKSKNWKKYKVSLSYISQWLPIIVYLIKTFQTYDNFCISGAKSDVTSTNATKLSADRIQFQLTLHEEEEEASSETFDSTIVSGHNQEDHTVV